MIRRLLLVVLLSASAGVGAQTRFEYQSRTLFNQHLYYGTFYRPMSLAYDRVHKELWVADSGNGLISVHQPDGAELYAFAPRETVRQAMRLRVSPDGRVFALDNDRAHVRVFDYRGRYKGDAVLAGLPEKPLIGAIAFDGDGNLYVGENHTSQVFVYAPDGRLRQQFGSRGTDEGQFLSMCAIAIDPSDGAIVVLDQQALAVQLFDRQGNFIRGWGRHEMGAENVSLPSGIAFDSKSRVLVCDEMRHQVKVFTRDGVLLTLFGGLGEYPGELAFPTDIAVDEHDRVYVTERSTGRVQVFEPVDVPLPEKE